MRISGNLTPDESFHSEDSSSSLDMSSGSDISSLSLEHYPRLRYLLTTNINFGRLFELSPESTQHNDECSIKLDSIIESQAEILQLLKLLKGIFSRNEQNESLVTMNNYWDKKWHQASAAFKNMQSTLMHIKGTSATTENKLNAILMKLEGFIQDDVPKLKQIPDECAAKNIVIEEAVHKHYDAVLNLIEVLCSEKSNNAVQTEEFARNVKDTNNRVKTVENLLMDIKNQLDNKSNFDNMEKALVTPSVQQHDPPNGSCATSPDIHHSSKTAIAPSNNPFRHVDSSHTKVGEKYLGNIHFISKCLCNRENSFQRRRFPDKHLKQNTPPFCVQLEPVDENCNSSNGVSTCHSSVSKIASFDNILSDSESKMDERRMFHKEAIKIPQTTACSDSKAEPDETVKKNDATNTRAKPKKTDHSKKCRKHRKGICYKKNSHKMVVPHPVVSTSKEQQNKDDLWGKEQHSKKNSPISTTALDVYKSDDNDDCTITEGVFKYSQFDYQQNISIVQENDANTQGNPSVSNPKKTITKDNYKSDSQAFASVSLASSCKKPVLQSGDKKRGLKKTILTTRAANHDYMVFTSNEQNVSMSEEKAGSMQEKLTEFSPRPIYSGQSNISYDKAISSAITSTSGTRRPATQQNQPRKGNKRNSKESDLNVPPENSFSADEACNPQLHFRPNIRMSRKNSAYNSPSIPSTSGGTEPHYFRTKDPSKRVKTVK